MRNSSGSGPPQLTWTNIVTTILVLFTAAGGSYALVQQQFAALERQFSKATDLNAASIGELKNELAHLRKNVIERQEHTEFVKRVDELLAVIREQLKVIETTRPTTGELQALGQGAERQITEIKEHMRSLEEYMRRPQALAPVTPSQVH